MSSSFINGMLHKKNGKYYGYPVFEFHEEGFQLLVY